MVYFKCKKVICFMKRKKHWRLKVNSELHLCIYNKHICTVHHEEYNIVRNVPSQVQTGFFFLVIHVDN